MEKPENAIVECQIAGWFVHDALTGDSREVDYEEWCRLRGGHGLPEAGDTNGAPTESETAREKPTN